ncbi:cytochrome c oxidase assembly protein [Micromonospora sp. WMMA1923]|uniref:cytochrome c oxidase assembly protein n=1 Tax=Micromonospora sp. WMMA1923 TaxID=3404125 RepID=UPI003B95F040
MPSASTDLPARLARVPRRFWLLLIGAGLAAAAIGLGVQAALNGQPYAVLGVGDAGAVVRTATPIVRLVANAGATVCVGALVFATFLTRPQATGVVAPIGYAALRTAARSALVWFLAALAMAPLDAADKAGVPLRRAVDPAAFVTLVDALGAPRAWLVSALCAGAVAVGCRRTLQWRTGAGLILVTFVGLAAPHTVGHSASQENHDLTTAAIIVHVTAAAVWLGTLVAVLRARGNGRDAYVWRRYRRLAVACAVLVAVSGLVDAVLLAPGGTLLTTGYGILLGAKAVVVVLLVVVMAWLSIRVGRSGGTRPLLRLIAAESLLLVGAYGLSVALTRIPAPKFLAGRPTEHETLIGYDLTEPLTATVVVTNWRVQIIFAPLAVVLAGCYLLGVRRLRSGGARWPAARTVAWCTGCALLLVGTSSGLGRYAPAMFSAQTVLHMLTGMLVPLLLVSGAPFTLAALALPAARGDQLPGPREWTESLRTAAPTRLLTHPLTGTLIFSGAPFLLFFTDLFGLSIRYHWAHILVHGCFMVIGFAFAWLVAGPDPLPRPTPAFARLGALMTAMPVCVVFATVVVNSDRIIGNGFSSGNMYTALDLPWATDFTADQRLGGYLALAIGEACMLVLLALLLLGWGRRETTPPDLAHPASVGHDTVVRHGGPGAPVDHASRGRNRVTNGTPDDDEVGRFDRDVTASGRGNT